MDEVLRAILMACETFQNKIVLLSLNCLRMLILRGVVKDETIAIVINLMKEQATNGDESVQLKVIQTVMATPPRMTLLNEAVVEQLMQLLFVLHNSASPSVHHTAEAGLTALAEKMAERAGAEVRNLEPPSAEDFALVRPAIRRSPQSMPMVQPAPAPARLPDPVKMFYSFVQETTPPHTAHHGARGSGHTSGEARSQGVLPMATFHRILCCSFGGPPLCRLPRRADPPVAARSALARRPRARAAHAVPTPLHF